jgi:hypothetical protein
MEAQVAVSLDDRAAWHDVRSGRLATNAEIRACLTALDALLIRGSYYAGPERTFLKNVTLSSPHVAAGVADSSPDESPAQAAPPSQESSSQDQRVLQVLASDGA